MKQQSGLQVQYSLNVVPRTFVGALSLGMSVLLGWEEEEKNSIQFQPLRLVLFFVSKSAVL